MSVEDYDFYDPKDYELFVEQNTVRRGNMNRLKENKFYIGSNSVLQVKHRSGIGFGTWGHPDIANAIAHAQKVLDDTPDQEYVFIVEIVKVVRRQKHPVIIEDI